ncbi:glucose-6-phosphate isomerase [Desulfurispira natronophila]|uniref:Glucose-6-phosphate isomerase n=1 Tax=Desulfurispira natronophila TaxID=682562 RepID=A0A7W8DG87_9BACT|nr:glucose-6-phosphate isomerase [Desulfurispira natronophila]MBB5021150.1 glucose-6-phosphate isomerase [Desulfurispira natronophila]
MVSIDYSLSMQENVPTGITPDELQQVSRQFEQGLYQQMESRFKDGTYAFRQCLSDAREQLPAIKDYVAHQLADMQNFVVVGIGGSNLGNIVLDTAFAGNGRKIYYLDNVEPHKVKHLLQNLDLKRTVFNIITKSGSTSETLANYLVVRRTLEEQRLPLQRHLLFTTDPKKGYLQQLRQRDGIPTFTIPPQLGGRFSVLGAVGFLSSAFKGIDINQLLLGAESAAQELQGTELPRNKGLLLAAIYLQHYRKGRNINVFMPYSDRLYPFGLWFRQLWAESLGKIDQHGQKVGQTPEASLGTVDQHSQVQLYMEGPDDKVITFVKVCHHDDDIALDGEIDYFQGQTMAGLLNTQLHATEMSLKKQKRCSLRLEVDTLSEWNLGYLMYLYMYATVAAGEMLGVNPVDQPGVEEGKQFTYGLLGRPEYQDKKHEYRHLQQSLRNYCV